jgi:hypothetical protein
LICPGCALDELKGGGERGPGCPIGDGPEDITACCWGFTCGGISCTSGKINFQNLAIYLGQISDVYVCNQWIDETKQFHFYSFSMQWK